MCLGVTGHVLCHCHWHQHLYSKFIGLSCMCVHLYVSIAAGNGSFQFGLEPCTTLGEACTHQSDTHGSLGAVVPSHSGSRAGKKPTPAILYSPSYSCTPYSRFWNWIVTETLNSKHGLRVTYLGKALEYEMWKSTTLSACACFGHTWWELLLQCPGVPLKFRVAEGPGDQPNFVHSRDCCAQHLGYTADINLDFR